MKLAATALVLISIALATSASSFAATPSADSSCVDTTQRDDLDHAQISLDFKNGCSSTRACAVTWGVKCDGKIKRNKDTVNLATGEQKTLTLSAKECDGDWEILPPSWQCKSSRK